MIKNRNRLETIVLALIIVLLFYVTFIVNLAVGVLLWLIIIALSKVINDIKSIKNQGGKK